MKKLIHFRDQGCQGAKSLVDQALYLAKNPQDIPVISNLKKIAYISNSEKNQENQNIWREISQKLQLTYSTQSDLHNIDKSTLLIVDQAYTQVLEELEKEENQDLAHAMIVESDVKDYLSSCALASFSTIIYTALRTGKAVNEISVNWMGDAGKNYHYFMDNTLNSTICLRNMLGITFEKYEEEAEVCAPEANTLSFVMQAGAKIFLTYEPHFLDENADILYISHWTYKQRSGISTHSHPYTFDAVKSLFSEKTQVISLLPEIESSSINQDLYKQAGFATRLSAVLYFAQA